MNAEPKKPVPLAQGQIGVGGRLRGASPAPRIGRLRGGRYSRFVTLMKFLLPAIALVLIALVVIWPQLQSDDSLFKLGVARLKATENGDPSLVNARFVGADNKNRPFTVTADLAKNVLSDTAPVELEMPKADVTMEDGSWLVLTAHTGLYDRTTKTLDLQGQVNLFHDSGYEFTTEKARVDLETGIASGDTPVEGQGPFGTLHSEGFRVVNQGDTIVFTGKSKLVLYPETTETERAQ
jgi:lipopolysaccharide export system protein LptC